MTIVGPCTADDYLLSFWTRQRQKDGEFPPKDEMRETLLRKYPCKFPFEGKKAATWQICRISTQEELENLWMHKSGDWLEGHGLWRSSNRLGDLAKTAIDTDFFCRYLHTGQYKNYHRWKDKSLRGQLDGHEKPILVRHEEYTDILDGFGRLLSYLALVRQGKEFFSFEAYLAS